VVMPGLIATPKVVAMPAELQNALQAAVPLQRFGTTEELAGTVCFLLSPAAAYLTGAVLRVDGGYGLSAGALTQSRRLASALPLPGRGTPAAGARQGVGQVERSLDGSIRYFVPVLRRANTARTSGCRTSRNPMICA